MATHYSILAWRIPWTEKPYGLQHIGSQRVLYTYTHTHTHTHIYIYTYTHTIHTHILCCCLVTKLCQILCDPMDCSLPGFPIHGIFQARIMDWVAISFSSILYIYRERAIIWSSNPTPGHISREHHNSKRYIHLSVHCSTVYNSQNMEGI